MGKTLDEVLSEIDNNNSIQDLLKIISTQLDNRNYFAMFEIPRLRQSKLDSDILVASVKKLHGDLVLVIDKNINMFSDSTTESLSGRLNYKQLLFYTKDIAGNIIKDNLADWMMIYILRESKHGIDDYVDAFTDCSLTQNRGLCVGDDGMVSLVDPRLVIHNHAIQLDNISTVYLHPFLRRSFSGNFVDIPAILRHGVEQGYDVKARLDPYREGEMKYYREVVECDYWHGAHFNTSILNSKAKNEKWTVHGLDETDRRTQALGMSYPILQTHFRTSMMDKNLRQFSIEEYTPRTASYGVESPNFGKKYYIQKYAHLVYDQNGKFIQHVDCSVRVFKVGDYLKLLKSVKSGNDPGRQIGKRYKLFKISGELELDYVQNCLYEFFRCNPLIIEYFTGKTFDETWDYLQS
ncbi:MAG: hypothetical protein WCJ36_00615 [Candidatus Saccharibacteria bacterium]